MVDNHKSQLLLEDDLLLQLLTSTATLLAALCAGEFIANTLDTVSEDS